MSLKKLSMAIDSCHQNGQTAHLPHLCAVRHAGADEGGEEGDPEICFDECEYITR